jgi:hypothetical protein
MIKFFPHSKSQRDKGCPRGAFLGLCEAGLVSGIKPGNYTGSLKNKLYAVEAVSILQIQPELADDPSGLWAEVLSGRWIKPNGQMDVVLGLWTADLIVGRDRIAASPVH